MKKLLTFLLFVAASVSVQAQSISGGLRVGPTAFLDLSWPSRYMPAEYQQGAITTELFARYQGKRRWAFEASLAGSSRLYYEQRITSNAPTWQQGIMQTKTHYYEFGLAAQYELSCRQAQQAARPPRLHYYLGISANAALVHNRSDIYAEGQPNIVERPIVSNDFQIWSGFNQLLAYDLTPQWTLQAKADFRVNLNSLTGIGHSYASDYPDAALGFRLGAAYRIWKKKPAAVPAGN